MKPLAYVALCVAAATLACGPAAQETRIPAATESQAVNPGDLETVVFDATVQTLAATVLPETDLPEEAILILAPAGGSRLVGQVHVEGLADSTFEQTLVVEVVLLGEPETVLAQQPVMIQAELGQRGPFTADVAFDYSGSSDQPGEVRVYAASPRDGGLTHLASAQVTLGSSGESDLRAVEAHPEQIVITTPAPAGAVTGGSAHVEGVALASFEQTLIAEIYDVDGALIGRAPISVGAPEYGVMGPFAVDITYAAGAVGPGRIVVRDPSPAFGQTLHLASVEIQIQP